MTAADFFARWRVRLGYLLAIVLFLARPTFHSILLGAAVGFVGLIIRAYAAGYLHKQEVLTVTGPYARTRNPLYFGSFMLALGFAVMSWNPIAAALLLIPFIAIYSRVILKEEAHLARLFPEQFPKYRSKVPRFFPQIRGLRLSFSATQYLANREYNTVLGFAGAMVILLVKTRRG